MPPIVLPLSSCSYLTAFSDLLCDCLNAPDTDLASFFCIYPVSDPFHAGYYGHILDRDLCCIFWHLLLCNDLILCISHTEGCCTVLFRLNHFIMYYDIIGCIFFDFFSYYCAVPFLSFRKRAHFRHSPFFPSIHIPNYSKNPCWFRIVGVCYLHLRHFL